MNLAEAYLAISEKIPIDDIKVKQRLDRAYDIIRANGEGYTITRYNTTEGDKYRIFRASTQLLEDNSAVYTTDTQSCTCPDNATARAGLCKHRLAIMLLVAMANSQQEKV